MIETNRQCLNYFECPTNMKINLKLVFVLIVDIIIAVQYLTFSLYIWLTFDHSKWKIFIATVGMSVSVYFNIAWFISFIRFKVASARLLKGNVVLFKLLKNFKVYVSYSLLFSLEIYSASCSTFIKYGFPAILFYIYTTLVKSQMLFLVVTLTEIVHIVTTEYEVYANKIREHYLRFEPNKIIRSNNILKIKRQFLAFNKLTNLLNNIFGSPILLLLLYGALTFLLMFNSCLTIVNEVPNKPVINKLVISRSLQSLLPVVSIQCGTKV